MFDTKVANIDVAAGQTQRARAPLDEVVVADVTAKDGVVRPVEDHSANIRLATHDIAGNAAAETTVTNRQRSS